MHNVLIVLDLLVDTSNMLFLFHMSQSWKYMEYFVFSHQGKQNTETTH